MRCPCVLCLGLAVGIALHHDPPHAPEPTPGALALRLGKFAIEAGSTSSTGGTIVRPAPAVIRATVLAPRVMVSLPARQIVVTLPARRIA